MSIKNNVEEKLLKLSEHARTHVWDPINDINWTLGGNWYELLSQKEKDALRSILSLVYHSDSQGNKILTDLCLGLKKEKQTGFLKSSPELADVALEFLELQMADEDRHAFALKILFEKLAMTPEEQSLSHRFYSKFLVSPGWMDAKLILVYWYIEIVAKNIFVELKHRFPETSIDSVFTRIVRDEARHASFGEVYIPFHAQCIGPVRYASMMAAHLTSFAALPALFKYGHYARAAAVLKLDLSRLFSHSMNEITAKIERLPKQRPMPAFRKSSSWLAEIL